MTNDYYALSPESEARLAADEYRDAVQDAQDAGHRGLRTGDFTGYAEAFQALQDTAHTAVHARRAADHAATVGARLRVVR